MDKKPSAKDSGRGAGEATAEKQRELQREQDRKEPAEGGSGGGKGAPQTSGRKYPEDLPSQHLQKPGQEADMELKPQFMAPHYKGSGKLEGMSALITGADSGIGRAVAVLYAREGADVAIVYLASHEDAEETKRCIEKEGRRCLLIPGDVKDSAFCKQAVEKAVKEFGKLDILVNNAAFQEHAHSLEDVTDERMRETFETNIMGYMRMARAALPHLKEGASIINTSSVTALKGSAKLLD
ncbi:MAG TPA: SDR family NAD(P)-dependent oxidoreductase, partial [Ramlibacter sp.]|uniref:SDR family NAD(P)-dependent oxidoreductase n=1 Tax=Ramlibacter sp. TaxID=1917967 RepID=UPI002D7E2913